MYTLVCVCAGDRAEPPGADQQRVHAGAGLPHRAHRLQVRRDQGEVRPPYWYYTRTLLCFWFKSIRLKSHTLTAYIDNVQKTLYEAV